MKPSRSFRLMLAPVAAAFLISPAAGNAHEGHKKDMSEAEMAQMEMQDKSAAHHGNANAMHDAMKKGELDGTAMPTVAPQTAEQALAARIAENRVTSTSDFLGRLHPVAAHFPIALLLLAALAELMLAVRPSLGLETTVRFLVGGGAIGAFVAAVFGWFAGGWRLEDRSETLGLHRWNGTAIAGVALIAAWLAFRARNRTLLRVLLAALAAALVLQGYHGGEMVFGPNHLGLE
ncbi:putative vegetatible incompatibility protein HET-E-1 [Altererythrobacter epoxidivorans]|uniref:Putative vegetatible incompatibility protein HET-E-1 n=1 Tax=Altererythrobacter epoxidivorans TaxID=361183 RepID=A0A0M4MTG3_9SPHN|nr:DUF2231 domain-containing protein [Altererythrobacter epoxidivorans]ALE15413.1 putative vegetatible incompatibility protein HET-E-1 [Altererythrobacter epoxidivorans]